MRGKAVLLSGATGVHAAFAGLRGKGGGSRMPAMNGSGAGRWVAVVLWLAGGAASAQAQQVLAVEHDGAARLVRRVSRGACYVEKDGKLVAARANARAALVDAKEFLPFFVSVSGMRASGSYVEIEGEGGGAEVNHQMEFHADFESLFRLNDVFLALELELEAGKYIFYHEVGELLPRKRKAISVRVPLSGNLGEGRFTLHLFSEGGELLHSQQPAGFREAQIDRVVARCVAGEKDAPARPFVGPAPEYPAALLQQRLSGEAVVVFRVNQRGAVVEPVVQSASRPEFGEAALAAVRLWRFLPRMKEGRPVEAKLGMPFKFDPPAEKS